MFALGKSGHTRNKLDSLAAAHVSSQFEGELQRNIWGTEARFRSSEICDAVKYVWKVAEKQPFRYTFQNAEISLEDESSSTSLRREPEDTAFGNEGKEECPKAPKIKLIPCWFNKCKLENGVEESGLQSSTTPTIQNVHLNGKVRVLFITRDHIGANMSGGAAGSALRDNDSEGPQSAPVSSACPSPPGNDTYSEWI
ncbi:hypothetical protein BJV82DRAFT_583098 [Fennellomyces sp. T-0311]|nr:hypothetical protein BJV82DRAFT_583098 [Fennellomyces sp. T-0311]